ncbi:PIN domain nuclease [Nocardia sp. NBC_01009]|uniref:PIN domain nuclease n=1 Tax=Nocardia sp. NBC_01009 TaxID=2975996 RepID=UPI0038662403|nr:PIN domain nuclease [Nocardia sp. NBC_01009]
MGVVTRYLVDKSALARLHLPSVRDVLVPLMDRALVHMCGVTELEMLYSARNSDDRARIKAILHESLEWVDTPEDLWGMTSDLQSLLTERAQHRSASIADLVVAVTAQAQGLTVLHYDNDFDTIASHTAQPTLWVVPAGTV